MDLSPYYFDVQERDIQLSDVSELPKRIPDYKAIVAPTVNGEERTISVVKKSYKLIRNQDLIEPFLEQIDKLDVAWKIDPSHSFAEINRMRLQITFPELIMTDSESEIPLSLYLHNSYDLSEGVRLYFGAIRAICSNGCVFGEILGKHYAKHTKGFSFDDVQKHFRNALDRTDVLQSHIHRLEEQPVDIAFVETLQESLGKRRFQKIIQPEVAVEKSKWQLLNDITHYISHDEEKPKRADLQLKVSQVFDF